MSLSAAEAASRMNRLAGTLQELRGRVREAVAAETGRAVGDAVRDVLTTALAGRDPPPRQRHGYGGRDDRDRWDGDDEDGDEPFYDAGPGSWKGDEEAVVRSRRWQAAVEGTAAAVRGWASRRVPGWVAAVVGLVVGAATLAGGTVARAVVALLGAAMDLLPLTDRSGRLALGLL